MVRKVDKLQRVVAVDLVVVAEAGCHVLGADSVHPQHGHRASGVGSGVVVEFEINDGTHFLSTVGSSSEVGGEYHRGVSHLHVRLSSGGLRLQCHHGATEMLIVPVVIAGGEGRDGQQRHRNQGECFHFLFHSVVVYAVCYWINDGFQKNLHRPRTFFLFFRFSIVFL